MLRLRADYLCKVVALTLGRSLPKVQDSIPQVGIVLHSAGISDHRFLVRVYGIVV